MLKIFLTALFLPSFFLAAKSLPPEASAALKFNQWYISQVMSGNEPLTNYGMLSRYVTRGTVGKLKALDKLDPNEYDVPDADMFIKAQGYEDDWGTVSVLALDYDAACRQVYISFGNKRKHTVVDCMVKEDGVWKVQSVARIDMSNNLTGGEIDCLVKEKRK